MQHDIGYIEQEGEYAGRQSSAGMATQNLHPLPAGAHSMEPPSRRERNGAALALISLGVVLLFSRFITLPVAFDGSIVLWTIASCFLFFAFWKRVYGLMIPGAILAGLGLGIPFAGLTNGVSVLWGLALGFLSILFLGRALFNVRNNWPVFPAVPLFAIGIIVAVASAPWIFAGSLIWLPLFLIGLGLYLGWGRRAA